MLEVQLSNDSTLGTSSHGGVPVLDLDYVEDSGAEADANFVLTGEGAIIEVQGTAEKKPFAESEFLALMRLARKGIGELCAAQRKALGQA